MRPQTRGVAPQRGRWRQRANTVLIYWVGLLAGSILVQGNIDAPCVEKIAVPKIAMLFLARSGMPLEAVWEPWFRSVAGLIPTEEVLSRMCRHSDPLILHHSLACSVDSSAPVLQQQALFSVYIHSSRHDFDGFAPNSLFAGTLIPEVVKTAWGDTIDATRAQLRHALQDPLNQRFITLSDTDIPTYPARLVYLQLMSEQNSRISACKAWDLTNINRYTCAMDGMGVDISKWRKGPQWLSFTRNHAEIVEEDEEVRAAFNTHCSGVFWDDALQLHRGCLSDEHYYHTLIASRDLEHETDCKGVLSFADFENSFEGHPRKYEVEDISAELIMEVRRPTWWMGQADCGANATTWTGARDSFMRVPVDVDIGHCDQLQQRALMRPMESWCPLFARKFAAHTADKLVGLFGNQEAGDVAIYRA